MAAIFQNIECQRDILHCAMWLLNQLVYLRIGCQMHHNIRLWVGHAADPAHEIAVGRGQILEQRGHAICPGIHALVDTEHTVAGIEQPQRQVGADLAARASD